MCTDEGGFYVVDRVEGSLAVIISDSEQEHLVSLTQLPGELREGDVLRPKLDCNGEPIWTTARFDKEESDRRKQNATATIHDLRRRDPGGDLSI